MNIPEGRILSMMSFRGSMKDTPLLFVIEMMNRFMQDSLTVNNDMRPETKAKHTRPVICESVTKRRK